MKKSLILNKILLLALMAVMALPAKSAGTVTDGRCKQWVDSVISQMSQQEQIGQLIVAVLPAQADRSTKKQVNRLVKKQKIGGLQFWGGTTQAQAELTNAAFKYATVPLMVLPTGKQLADELIDVPSFPSEEALQCITDPGLLQAYDQEVDREYRELGMANSRLLSDEARQANLLEEVVVTDNPKAELAKLQQMVALGRLPAATLEERCRKVLTFKYLTGLRTKQKQLHTHKISNRVNSEEAQGLTKRLHLNAVTVVSNHFHTIPLIPVEGGIAVLSIGNKGTDTPFVEALKRHSQVTVFHLSGNADDATCQQMQQRLQPFRRLVVSLTDVGLHTFIGAQVTNFLTQLEVKAPIVYTVFGPQTALPALNTAVSKANSLVLAHSSRADVQQHVADVLFAKASAQGRLGVSISENFPAGSGYDITVGMQPSDLIPEDHGLRASVLQRIDEVARKGVTEGAYPGCRILLMKDGKIVYDKGFGTHSDKNSTAVRGTDLFDLADLTRPMATLLAVMKLYDNGKLKLTDKVSTYVTQLRNGNKRNITVRDILLHEGGLLPYIRFYLDMIDPNSVHGPYSQSWKDKWHYTQISENSYFCSDFKFKRGLVSSKPTPTHTMQMAEGLWMNKSFKNTLIQTIAKSDLLGSRRYVESSLGFILLQQVVEKVSKMSLDEYVAQEFYAPMGLTHTLFRPLEKFGKENIMPTAANDFLRRQDLHGYVQDETAACLGGVAGNAGLFSTAEEVAAVFQMLLDGGKWNGQRLLSESTCKLFTTETSNISRRGLGFDRPDTSNALRSPCSPSTPAEVFGQTGNTGTYAWADPVNNLVYVFLSNRLCPNAWNTKLIDMKLSKEIQEIIYKSLE